MMHTKVADSATQAVHTEKNNILDSELSRLRVSGVEGP